MAWEEDPRWQQAQYRFLLWCLGVGTLLVTALSLWYRDWEPIGYWLAALAVLVAALGLYAALIWTAAQALRLLAKLIRRRLRRQRKNS
jgi:hypothetical protein